VKGEGLWLLLLSLTLTCVVVIVAVELKRQKKGGRGGGEEKINCLRKKNFVSRKFWSTFPPPKTYSY
jgi:hypothetical protein